MLSVHAIWNRKRRMGRRAGKKRARRTRAQREEDEKPDRLSGLPDAIIHQILSLLELKDAIQTCVLSKRWKYLWVSVPDLKFHARGFTRSKFRKFVLNVLSTRADCNICKFRLDCWFNLDHSLVKRVLNYVASHKVQHLNINFGEKRLHSCLPLGPFLTCNTLKTLKLSIYLKDLSESFGFGFTKLTSLYLHNCWFLYESTGSADPFATCTNLKILSLRDCYFSNLQVLKISGLQLLNLELVRGWLGKVEIFAPKLASFHYDSIDIMNFSRILDMPSVNYANILLDSSEWICMRVTLVEKQNRSLRLINLLRGLCNAQVVKLSAATIECLAWFPHLLEKQPSPFKRLKSLKVEYGGQSSVRPDLVKTYLLGDNPHEETMCEEASPDGYGTTRFVEFRKVEA